MKRIHIYAVRVSELSNELLAVHHGWKVGDFVRERDSGYGGKTFGICTLSDATFYEVERQANFAIADRIGRFSGVRFEVVRFDSDKS